MTTPFSLANSAADGAGHGRNRSNPLPPATRLVGRPRPRARTAFYVLALVALVAQSAASALWGAVSTAHAGPGVTINPANATTISVDTAATAAHPAWTSLAGPTITEGASGDIGSGDIVLAALNGFDFNTGAGVTATIVAPSGATCAGSNALKLLGGASSQFATVSTNTVTITVTQASAAGNRCAILFTGLQVRPIVATPLASGSIVKTAGSSSSIAGVAANSTSFGALATVAGAPARLVFSQQPGSGTSGTALSTQPGVTVQDQFGHTATGDTGAVTLAIAPSTGAPGATVACATNPQATSGGVATFGGCKVAKAGAGYTLTASWASSAPASAAGAPASASSAPFDVAGAPPTGVAVVATTNNPLGYISGASKSAVSVAVSFAAAPEPGTVSVELSDGVQPPVVTTAPADVTGTTTTVSGIDASALADGPITVRAKHTASASGLASALATGTPAVKKAAAPSAPTGVTFTAAGGTMVAGKLNSTNTGFRVNATITPGQATGGRAELLKDGAPFTTPVVLTTIGANDATVTLDPGFTSTTALQAAFPPPAAGTPGYALSVRLTDAAGNTVTSATANPPVAVDYQAPPAPSGLALAAGGDSGAADSITNVNRPAITGTAEANSTVEVFRNVTGGTTSLGIATANATGAWTFTPAPASAPAPAPALADGDHSITAKATDAAGNVSPASAPLALKIDTTSPTYAVAVSPTPAKVGPVTITVTASEALAEAPVLKVHQNGTGGAVDVLLTPQNGTSTTVFAGTYPVQAANGATILDGPAAITLTGKDVAGNTGTTITSGSSFVVSTAAGPESFMPVLTVSTSKTAARDTATLVFSGTLSKTGLRKVSAALRQYSDPDATVQTGNDLDMVGSLTIAGASLGGSFTVAVFDGEAVSVKLIITVEDDAGNRATGTSPALPIDNVPPDLVVPTTAPLTATSAQGAVLDLTGGLDSLVSVTDDSNQAPTLTCTPPNGSMAPLGTTAVSCTAEDRAGNVTVQSFTVTVASLISTPTPVPQHTPTPATNGLASAPASLTTAPAEVAVSFPSGAGQVPPQVLGQSQVSAAALAGAAPGSRRAAAVVQPATRAQLDLALEPGLSASVNLRAPAGTAVTAAVESRTAADLALVAPELTRLAQVGLVDVRRAIQVSLIDNATGQQVVEPGSPAIVSLSYAAADLTPAGGDPARFSFLIMRAPQEATPACPAGTFVAQPAVDQGTRTLTLETPCASSVALVLLKGALAVSDYAIPAGHFYTQASGLGGRGGAGHAIVDDAAAPFWSEFQRLGDVAALGYPAGRRTVRDGFPVQLTQRFVLQWRPEHQETWFANVFDDLHERGFDAYLEAARQIPPPFDTAPDAGLEFSAVADQHVQKILAGQDLTGEPVAGLDEAAAPALAALRERFLADPDWLAHYGLPVSVGQFPASIVLRAQRVAMQYWLVDQPFARAGEITVVLGGDLAKEAGLWQLEETAPQLPPMAAR